MSAVVIGWGLRTPLGATVGDVVGRVLAGERGGGPAVGHAAASRHGRFLSRLPLLALDAAHEAVAHAGISGGDRVGVFAAVGGLHIEWTELAGVLDGQRDDGDGAWKRGLERIHPFWMLRNLSNNGHALLAADLGARGEGTTCGGATAGAQAIAAATRSLAAGLIDAAVVVAYDTLLSPEDLVDLADRGGLAPRARTGAYDATASGIVPGEAAGALVLVREVTGSGVRPLARIAAASGADGELGEPLATTISRAAARICPGDRGSIIVDGAARAVIPLDREERAELAQIVGPQAPLVATASATGALGAATAIVQTIVVGELLRRATLPPIAGLARAAPGPLRPIATAERSSHRVAVCLSTGAPGLAAAVRVEAAS